MKFASQLSLAGVVLAVLASTSTEAGAAAVNYFANNTQAGATVVDGIGPNANPRTQRDQFKNNLSTSLVEIWNVPPTPSNQNPSTFSDVFGTGSGVTLTSVDAVAPSTTVSKIQNNPIPSSTETGRFNTSGDPTVKATTVGTSGWFETNKSTTTIQFTTAVKAFGTFITDVGDFKGALAVEIFNGATSLYSANLISAGSLTGNSQGGLAFFGYLNDTISFDKVVFKLTQASGLRVGDYDFIGFDDFITGVVKPVNNTPEPTSLALAGLALVAAGCIGRRARRKA